MKKFFKILGVVLCVAIISSVLVSIFWKDEPSPDVPSDGSQTEAPSSDDQSEEPTKDVTIEVDGVYRIVVSTEAVELGKTVMIYGGSEGATLRVLGEGNGAIRASKGGQLIVKDLTIEDQRENAYTQLYINQLRFGGKVRFENCTFKDVIYVMDDAEAEFVNCTFNSPQSRYYSVWVGDGSASFEGCTFTGYRGLKIHEFEGEDVTSVMVNNCEFRGLTEKVGVVIGKFTVDPMETVVRITNSRFIDCQAWDSEGSLAGVDGFYETDMAISEYAFSEQNNEIEFTPISEDDYWTPNY